MQQYIYKITDKKTKHIYYGYRLEDGSIQYVRFVEASEATKRREGTTTYVLPIDAQKKLPGDCPCGHHKAKPSIMCPHMIEELNLQKEYQKHKIIPISKKSTTIANKGSLTTQGKAFSLMRA